MTETVKLPRTDILTRCHEASISAGWWNDLKTGEPKNRNVGESLCLVHSEISEAYEAYVCQAMDEKLPHHKGVSVELADVLIRLGDYSGGYGYETPSIEWVMGRARRFLATRSAPTFADLHATVSRLMEAERKGMTREARQNRLNDVLEITVALCMTLNVDIVPIISEKLLYNMDRPDHKPEARLAEGGKAF